ncbi:hypothetical protein DPMN_148860 [Dreissena polymorpha]|uniref:Uncharacterized protein n=1 Tax=Dreissena polymorpha TaxID=45954 RepID=A0A9D4FAP2_DREPO|nr:hypothetical protein DPMN_148860 [Dreissena polymorpha]
MHAQLKNGGEWITSQPSRQMDQEVTAVNECMRTCGDRFGGKFESIEPSSS